MELSSEDNLKLNVLLANAQAVRINESTLCVHGLTATGEARIRLNPTCRADKYLTLVRECLATHVLGSPRGYPVYLRRWTRMGEMHNTRLEPLLLLGESEALIAVARSPGLTDELARRIWWASPSAEIARYMLQHPAVVNGRMGVVLAEFLVEFLPFEEHPISVIETVELILQPGLIGDSEKRQIWDRGARKNHFYVGFLSATPDDLPDNASNRHDLALHADALMNLGNNPYAEKLFTILSANGQLFLSTCAKVLRKPADQDVSVALVDALADYHAKIRGGDRECDSTDAMRECVQSLLEAPPAPLAALLAAVPALRAEIEAMLLLAHSGEPLLRPIFARSDAVGSVMRKKIEPVVAPLLGAIAILTAGGGRPSVT